WSSDVCSSDLALRKLERVEKLELVLADQREWLEVYQEHQDSEKYRASLSRHEDLTELFQEYVAAWDQACWAYEQVLRRWDGEETPVRDMHELAHMGQVGLWMLRYQRAVKLGLAEPGDVDGGVPF